MMKKGSLLVVLVITAIAITACGCQSESTNNATSNAVNDNTTQEVSVSDNGQVSEDMKMSINGTMVNVAWEQNESVDALKQLVLETLFFIQAIRLLSSMALIHGHIQDWAR